VAVLQALFPGGHCPAPGCSTPNGVYDLTIPSYRRVVKKNLRRSAKKCRKYEIMADFKERLKKSIRNSGKSLEEVARLSGVSKRTIEGWIRNMDPKTPKIDQGYSVAKVLGVSLDELVSGEPPEGLSPEAYRIAQTFNNLSPAGQKAAQSMLEGLLQDYPRRPMQAENPAG
jgi:transcriptional regulator with XRE-family HTH domain